MSKIGLKHDMVEVRKEMKGENLIITNTVTFSILTLDQKLQFHFLFTPELEWNEQQQQPFILCIYSSIYCLFNQLFQSVIQEESLPLHHRLLPMKLVSVSYLFESFYCYVVLYDVTCVSIEFERVDLFSYL